ncbi:MAG: hypothetical protein ACE5FZ_06680 [Nitrospiria bacterium]
MPKNKFSKAQGLQYNPKLHSRWANLPVDPPQGWEDDPTGIPDAFCLPVESPPKPPEKPAASGKKPIYAIMLDHWGNNKFEVWIGRRNGRHRVYSYVTRSSAERLLDVVGTLELLNFVWVLPRLKGWTAYVDLAVFPPPKRPKEKACFNCEIGTMKAGKYGWYCSDCDTFEADEETSEIVDGLYQMDALEREILDLEAKLTARKHATISSINKGVA